jgi:hypothetical protein
MAGDITRLNAGVLRNVNRWQETKLRINQSYGKADGIKRTQIIEVSKVTM